MAVACSLALDAFLKAFLLVEEGELIYRHDPLGVEMCKSNARTHARRLEKFNPFWHRGRLYRVAWTKALDEGPIPFLELVPIGTEAKLWT